MRIREGLFPPRSRADFHGVLMVRRTGVPLRESTRGVLTRIISVVALRLPPSLSKILKWQKLAARFD